MQRMLTAVGYLVQKDEGQDLLEYVLLVALISIAAVVAVRSVGTMISDVLWQYIADTHF